MKTDFQKNEVIPLLYRALQLLKQKGPGTVMRYYTTLLQ